MFALALAAAISFPEPSPETRPWGICHLLGSAAETGELSREMRRWSEGGLGGVRVVPIYGANGYEDKYVEFMSPRFVSILKDFNRLSRENGMKFDLSFGAGWCFGGKSVPPELGVQALKTVKDGDAMPRRAKVLWEAIPQIPLERILVETDAPFILPYCKDVIQPKLLRRARNTSLILPAVITKIAALKGISPDEVERTTTKNTIRLFQLPIAAEDQPR